MKTIQLTQGKQAIVDDEDYDDLNKLSWHAMRHRKTFYAKHTTPRDGNGKQMTIRMHRYVLGITDSSVQVDHKNRNGLDNRKSNLRVVNSSQQSMNRSNRKGSSSNFIGVSWDSEKNKWKARICKNGKDKHLGYFEHEEEAAMIRDQYAKDLHGEYANLNLLEP